MHQSCLVSALCVDALRQLTALVRRLPDCFVAESGGRTSRGEGETKEGRKECMKRESKEGELLYHF